MNQLKVELVVRFQYNDLFQINKMPPTENMLKKSDCDLPPPKGWPGKYNKDNKDGTLMTKDDWMKTEAKVWFEKMKKHEKYDDSYFSVKVHCLLGWLKKEFPKITTKETKNILYGLEETADDQQDDITTKDQNQTENNVIIEEEPMDTDFGELPGTPDTDMFDSDDMEEEKSLTRKEKEQLIKEYADNVNKDMLEREESMPDFVKNSRIYKQRKDEYIEEFVDQLFEKYTSQDIANSMSQLPNFIQNHAKVKDKLSHRSRMELSSWRVLKNLNETCKELQKDGSKEAYEHRVMLTASVTCPRYGVPAIEETRNVIDAAKKLKKLLFSGEQSTLKVEERKTRELFPKKVFDLANESWETDATIPEPAQHSRPTSAVSDGSEKLPARLQVLTNDEAYEQFKDKYKDKVHGVMKEHCDKIRSKYEGSKESSNRDKILSSLKRKEITFPSKTWFLQQKPPKTKLNHDHSTGLCKDCQEGQLNYESLLKFVKKMCCCRTDMCPNFVCICEDFDDCNCSRECECEDCESCQVKL